LGLLPLSIGLAIALDALSGQVPAFLPLVEAIASSDFVPQPAAPQLIRCVLRRLRERDDYVFGDEAVC
jgi:hypothetical protein